MIGEANDETRPVFEAKAKKVGAPITFAEDEPEILRAEPLLGGGMQYFTKHNRVLQGDLGGCYQEKNMKGFILIYGVAA